LPESLLGAPIPRPMQSRVKSRESSGGRPRL
jgi:hypothetical protein